MRRALRDDTGQALIAVALAMVVLLGAIGLGLDWGLAVAQRRTAQNAADAAAMGAARWLATSVVLSGGSIAFAIDQEQVYCYAKAYADAAQANFTPPGASTSFTLEYGDGASPTNWTTSATSACPTGSTGTTVPAGTVYVRATGATTYRSTIAAVFGMPQITADARAKARLTGTIVADGLTVWPMIRHYDPADFDLGSCKKPPCDPTALPPIMFWSSSGALSDMVYGNFKGLIDPSIWSTRYPVSSQVPQLLTDWDRTGSVMAGTSPKPDMSGNCGGAWDTHGDSDPANNDKQCSITNWFYYPFGGQLSLTTDWATAPAGQEAPADIGARASGVCSGSVPGLVAPSCIAGAHSQGDWVETAFGNLGSNVSALLQQFISEHGKYTSRSNDFVPGSKSVTYGKALVMYVYLWDCAETFNGSAPAGSQWSLVLPRTGDCSQISDGAGIPTIDRVHLFSVAPFTFYEGLITTTTIQGFWGGAFGDPSMCQSDPSKCRPLDLFMNTAFLVADD